MKPFILLCLGILLGFSSVLNAEEEALFSQGINTPPAPATPAAKGDKTDAALTTRQAAVECATALITEKAGQSHIKLKNPLDASFKAGLCSGKLQTYLLEARAEHPACFPKISLEEAMRMFVAWVEAHPDQGALAYPQGFKAAFADTIPCLKETTPKSASAGQPQ